MSNALSKEIWRKPNFEKLRNTVREELDAVAPPGTAKRERIRFAIRNVIECGNQKGEEALARQYIFSVFALVEHGRTGGLNEHDKSMLMGIAERVLKIFGIPLEDSRLAYLHGDLYTIKSQIHRVDGKHILSLWEEQIAGYLAQKASDGRTSFQSLSIAIHLLRMGHASLALKELGKVRVGDLDARMQWRWHHEMHLALRLSYQLKAARAFYEEHNPWIQKIGGPQFDEWEWEGLCRESQETGEIESLMVRCLPKRKFHGVPTLIEAFFLARIVKQKQWMERFNYLPSKRSLGAAGVKWEDFLVTAHALKAAYGQKDDYVVRLETLGKALTNVGVYRSVYQELLVRAAVVRWLLRRISFVFEEVAVAEYQLLCQRLSDGKTKDVLNLLPDIATPQRSIEKTAA